MGQNLNHTEAPISFEAAIATAVVEKDVGALVFCGGRICSPLLLDAHRRKIKEVTAMLYAHRQNSKSNPCVTCSLDAGGDRQ